MPVIISLCVSVSMVATIFLYASCAIGCEEEAWEGFFFSPKWIKEYSTMNTFGVVFTTILLLITVPLTK